MNKVIHIIRQLDRLLPALLFAVLLSVQGVLAVGAADSLVVPGLIGPDGRTLTFADICNTAREDGAGENHCKDCSLVSGIVLFAPSPTVVFSQSILAVLSISEPANTDPKTPERWQYNRRGPPQI